MVVVNYGSHRLLQRHLVLVPDEVPVVVVDSFHSEAERTAVAALAAGHGWDLVALPDNPGFGAAVNRGVERARSRGGNQVLLLNPDAAADPRTVRALFAHVTGHPDDVVSPRLVDATGRQVFGGSVLELRTGALRAAAPGDTGDDAPPTRAWLTAACLALSVAMFERAGRFCEDYFLYWEDVELTVRAAAAGARLVVRHDLTVTHDEGGTHRGARPTSGKSALYYRWNTRNRLLFAARNLSRRDVLRWVCHTPAQSWAILLRGGRRQLLRSPRPLAAAVRGSAAGVSLAVQAAMRPARPATRSKLPVDVDTPRDGHNTAP